MPAEEELTIKRGPGPTFLILIEVFHNQDDLPYLLDFVQRTRKELRNHIFTG